MIRFAGSGVSDVGLVREHNEDAAFVGPYVALVADGVGGAAAGEVASATCAYVVSAMALTRFGEPLEPMLREAVAAARLNLAAGVREAPARDGMATTLTAVVCDGHRVVLGHLGDSRAYLYRDGDLTQISRDHTYVQQMVDSGQLAAEAVPTHRWRNVVLRSVHALEDGDLADIELTELDVGPGDRVMVCSDGLSDFVDVNRMQEVLGLQDPQSAAAVLTQAALMAGGRDNVTCLVVDLVESPVVVGDGLILGALRDFTDVIDPAYVRRG